MKKKQTNQFCLDLLKLPEGKLLSNLVMALSSYDSTSVVELSESPLYSYQYSSIFKTIACLAKTEKDYIKLAKEIQKMCLNHSSLYQKDFALLSTDLTPIVKYHSGVLENRHIISVPNRRLAGTAPLSIGYSYSFVNWQDTESGWSLPLASKQVKSTENNNKVGGEQIQSLLTNSSLPFHSMSLVVNTLDSAYLSPHYLEQTKPIDNLVSIIRLRSSMKVFARPSQKNKTNKKIYGQCYYLIKQSGNKWYKKHPKTKQPYKVFQTSITDLLPDQQLVLNQQLKNGRAVQIYLYCWEDKLLRTKDGISMLDKPFTIVSVVVKDAETGHNVFSKPMYLGVFGLKKGQLNAEQIYLYYLERSGIEGFFRHAKQKMHMNNYQALSNQCLDNWMLVIQLANWLIYKAKDQVENYPKKWQQYNPTEQRQKGKVLTISQTRKSMQGYLLTFDLAPFACRKSKGGFGRKKGQTQTKRKRFGYVKKKVKIGIDSS